MFIKKSWHIWNFELNTFRNYYKFQFNQLVITS